MFDALCVCSVYVHIFLTRETVCVEARQSFVAVWVPFSCDVLLVTGAFVK